MLVELLWLEVSIPEFHLVLQLQQHGPSLDSMDWTFAGHASWNGVGIFEPQEDHRNSFLRALLVSLIGVSAEARSCVTGR